MARIRTIKPEFWTSEQVMDCGAVTRLLFIGLWNFVDDFGRCPLAPRTIKAQIMPADNFSGDDILAMLTELQSAGLVAFYSVEGKDYLEITGWSKHQKIDNPSKYKVCPAPSGYQSPILAIPSEESPTIGLEGKGGERNREELKTDIPPVAKATRPASRFPEFWAEYPKRDGDNPRAGAEKKFDALVKSGVDPQALIDGARQSSADYRRRGNYGTQYVPQAVKWLNDKRWIDAAAAAFDDRKADAIASTKFYAADGSEQLEAWSRHKLETTGKHLPRDKNGGWQVDAEWPPGYVAPDRLERPPDIPQMRSMN